jgi:ribose transport system ATP-binding protein
MVNTVTAPVSLSVRHLSMTFGATRVLSDVSVDFAQGRVTALLGLNGSGKSTLVRVLAGFYTPEPGASLVLDGSDLDIPVDPRIAHKRGLRFVHQNLALVDDLSVADNIAFAQGFAGRSTMSPIGTRRHRRRASVVLSRLGVSVDPDRPVSSLSSTERMLVAIGRAFDVELDARHTLVILDEPTAYLPANTVDRVFELLDTVRQQGGTVVYITHRIDEVVRIADDVVILRDGRVVVEQSVGSLSAAEIAALIVGEPTAPTIGRRPRRRDRVAALREGARVLLSARAICGARLDGVTFDLGYGEILGVAGLIGCGRSELVRIVTGVQQPVAGELRLADEPFAPRHPRDALARGVACVPADRHASGIIGDLSLRANVTLGDLRPYWTRWRLNRRDERTDVQNLMARFDIRPPRTEQTANKFSGGNQQKAVIAKLTRLKPRLLVVDEPTQGIDVHGKEEVTNALRAFAAGGGGVLLASSDFEEVASVCDRVLVLDRGRRRGIFKPESLDARALGTLEGQSPSSSGTAGDERR